MDKKTIIIATIRPWNIAGARTFKRDFASKYNVFIITQRKDLTYGRVRKIAPGLIFFPHWSWLIPPEIHRNFECIAFHMTDLPFGRGGSPLQNLVIRGLTKTKISAFRVGAGLDAGPLYLKHPLGLQGRAEQIYRRLSGIIFKKMIPAILRGNLKVKPQKGKIEVFRRRKPLDSKIPFLAGLGKAYDYIRMHDAEGYPAAFLETRDLRFEFRRPRRGKNFIKAEVLILPKEKKR